MANETGMEELQPMFTLMSPCYRCSKLKMSCSRAMNCNHCKERHGCTFSEMEIITRGKSVYRNICEGVYFHNDIVKYQLYLQGCNVYTRNIMKSTEARDIYKRLTSTLGASRGNFKAFNIESLPQKFQDLVGNAKYYKVEWMFNGSYKIHVSDEYAEEIIQGQTVIDTARQHRIPYKLVDFSNTNSLDCFYRLWVESVFAQMIVSEMKVGVFLRKSYKVVLMNMKMITQLVGYDSMITLTILHENKRFKF